MRWLPLTKSEEMLATSSSCDHQLGPLTSIALTGPLTSIALTGPLTSIALTADVLSTSTPHSDSAQQLLQKSCRSFLRTDTLCFPAAVVVGDSASAATNVMVESRQEEIWTPLRRKFEEMHNVLTALETAARTAQSFILADLLVGNNQVSPEEATAASLLEEDCQTEACGFVEGEHDRRRLHVLSWLSACRLVVDLIAFDLPDKRARDD